MARKKQTTIRGTRRIKGAVPVRLVATKRKKVGEYNTPLKQTMKANHRFATTISIDPTTGGLLDKAVFRANGMFQPLDTGTTHQPMGFDQLSLLYEHFTVIGSKIKVQVINSDANYSAIVGVSVLSDSTGFTGNIEQYLEQGKSKYLLLSDSVASTRSTVRSTFSTKKYFGKSNVLDEDDLKGSSTADPNEMAYYHIVAAPLQGVDLSPVKALVTIEYSCIWHEPRTLAQS